MISATIPSGKHNRHDGCTFRKRVANSDRLGFQSSLIAVFKRWSRMPSNRVGRLGLKDAAMGSDRDEDVMTRLRRSIGWPARRDGRNGCLTQTFEEPSTTSGMSICLIPLADSRKGTHQTMAESRICGPRDFHPTEAGTPQGGVISPLLANIALHGMEEALGVKHRRGQTWHHVHWCDMQTTSVSFVKAERMPRQLRTAGSMAQERGLEFSSEKTRIVHLTEGIDFLGFHIRLYPASTTKTGWKLLTTPSKKSIQKHRDQMKQEWQAVRGWSIRKILWKLNPIIRGWANYFRTGTAKDNL